MIKVSLMLRKGRKCWECQWRDPLTGRLCTQTTETPKYRDAERFAGALQASLNDGTYVRQIRNGWSEVADRYERDVLAGKARGTLGKWLSTRCKVETYINPLQAASVTAERISELTHRLRQEKLAEPTIKSHLTTLRAMLRWAAKLNLIRMAPHIEMPTRTATSKGRPITEVEFRKMLEVVPKIVGNENAAGWKFLMRFLWASGLRLGEALKAEWETGLFAIIMSGDHPRLAIAALADKSGKPRLLPLAPEAADLLRSIPEEQRTGRLFTLGMLFTPDVRRLDTISKTISRIGQEAGVVVSGEAEKQGCKYASAHDFRRSFGARWAARVLPQQLQEMMRHKSITTTLTYYVGSQTEAIEQAMYGSVAKITNTSANTVDLPAS